MRKIPLFGQARAFIAMGMTVFTGCMIMALPHNASAIAGVISTATTAAVAASGASAATTATDDDDGD